MIKIIKPAIIKTTITKTSIIITLMMMITALAGCDGFHYHPVTQDRTAEIGGEWTGIALDGVGEIAVYLNRSRKIIITAHTDVIDHITVADTSMSTHGPNILRVGLRDGAQVGGKGPINIEIHTPSIASIELTGSGNIRIVSGNINGRMSKINARGNIDNASIQNADIQNYLYIAHSGVGNINAWNLAADAVTVKHLGSGRVTVTAVSVLNAAIASEDGEVVYRYIVGGRQPPGGVNPPPPDWNENIAPIVQVPASNVRTDEIPSHNNSFNDGLWVVWDGDDPRIVREGEWD